MRECNGENRTHHQQQYQHIHNEPSNTTQTTTISPYSSSSSSSSISTITTVLDSSYKLATKTIGPNNELSEGNLVNKELNSSLTQKLSIPKTLSIITTSTSVSATTPTTPNSIINGNNNNYSTALSTPILGSITGPSTPLTPIKNNNNNNQLRSSSVRLLKWTDMPEYLQFNPYIHTGYRPLQNVKGCVYSLFGWHNETINILSHGLPILYILATVPAGMPWEKDFRFLSFCHIIGSLFPWCGSFIYHLFMNLENGQNVYYRLLKIDMIGIWFSQSFGALPMLTATTFCFSFKLKCSIIVSYSILSIYGLYKAITASSPWQRRLCFLLAFLMRTILIFLRTIRWVGGNPDAITHVYLQDGVSVLGAIIGASHIPEKWFPGSVDLYFNSHNIMHILVVVAVYSMHRATLSDFEWMSKTQCNITTNSSETIDNIAVDSRTTEL